MNKLAIFVALILAVAKNVESAICGDTIVATGPESSGFIDGTAGFTDSICTWDITADHGYLVEFTFHIFEVDTTGTDTCTTVCGGTACKTIVEVSEKGAAAARTFCKGSTGVPGVIITKGRKVVVKVTYNAASKLKFYISWRVVPAKAKCCKNLLVTAEASSQFALDPYLNTWLGNYTQAETQMTRDTEGNEYPVYLSDDKSRSISRMEDKYFRPWVMTTSDYPAGGNRGVLFFGPDGSCLPEGSTAATEYDFYKSDTQTFSRETKVVTFTCTTVCKGLPPAKPPNTLVSDIPTTALPYSSSISYTCNDGANNFKLFSVCQPSGLWSVPSKGGSVCPAPAPALPPLLRNNLPTRAFSFNTTNQCVHVKSLGWPSEAYGCGTYTWRFAAPINNFCSFQISFDSGTFDIRGTGRMCRGDRLSLFTGPSYEMMKICGTSAPADININNNGQENRLELRTNNVDFGMGFMAVICAVECPAGTRKK